MACFLALETGGQLLREDNSGSLLLEFCANDNTPAGNRRDTEARRRELERESLKTLRQRQIEQNNRERAEKKALKRAIIAEQRQKDALARAETSRLLHQSLLEAEIARQNTTMEALARENEQKSLQKQIMINLEDEEELLAILYSLDNLI